MPESNWIDSLVQDCSHAETPISWLWWSFVTAISAVAGNNYYVKAVKGDVVYRPNLYVILLGESGLGKGFPVSRTRRLVDKSKSTRVIAGRSSIQAIVQELSQSKTKPGERPIMDSRGFIVNGELSTAIIADPDALTILTDLYDGHYNPEWTNLLKGTGAEKLKNPYITALFGSSPAHFYDSIPQANIEGGYIGRNLVIYEEKRSKDIDLLDIEVEPESPEELDKFDTYIAPKYVPHLEKIAANQGRLIPSDAARTLFNEWRRKWRSTQEADKTGFLNRVPDHVLKVAMCLSLANPIITGVIDVVSIETAIDKVTKLTYGNKRTADGRGLDPLAQQKKFFLDCLLKAENQTLMRKVLLTKGYGTYDAAAMDKIIEDLLEMGWVKRERFVAGKATDWIIHLAGLPLENYHKWLATRNGDVKR